MAISRGSKIQREGGVKYFGRVSNWTFSFKWFCTFITIFYPQQGVQILENSIFSQKSPLNKVLCSHKSPDCGYIDILDAFEDITVYLECFGGDSVK